MLKQTRNLLKRVARDDRGQVMVLMALLFVVLAGSTGFVIDVGSWYREKADLQSAVDAGAMAGAQELNQGTASATSTADELAKKNKPNGTYTVNIPESQNSVTVNGVEQAPTYFSRILGINYVTIRVTATAELAPLSGTSGLTPIGMLGSFEPYDYGKSYTLAEDQTSSPGNFSYLDFYQNDPNPPTGNDGAQMLATYVTSTEKYPISIGESIPTETGQKTGPAYNALDTLIGEDPTATFDTVQPGSPRLLTVPIINYVGSGKTTAVVTGFAVFFLDQASQSSKTVTGQFIKMITPGDASPSAPNYGARSTVLIK